jgi:hypothetical protein
MWVTRGQKNYPETAEKGQFWRATVLDMATRLRVARGIAKTETEASREAFQTLKYRGHPDAPPPLISDGWGGIDDALIEVYGQVPPYKGRGRRPTRKRPVSGWQYVQMIKQRKKGRVVGIKIRVVFGDPDATLQLLGHSTAYIERTHLTMRHFNGRLARKTLAFSKEVAMYQASATWEDLIYNVARPLKTLRVEATGDPRRRWRPRSPAMAAGLTEHIWTVKELLETIVPPSPINT